MEVLRTAILDMLRRKKNKSFSSAEVIQQMYPEDWEQFVEDVNKEAIALFQEGLITIDGDGSSTDSDFPKKNSLQISSPNKL